MPVVQTHIVVGASVEGIASVKDRLAEILSNKSNSKDELDKAILDLVERIRIAPGQIDITLSAEKIAGHLGVKTEHISAEHLNISAEFHTENVVLKRSSFLQICQANMMKPYSGILQRHMVTLI